MEKLENNFTVWKTQGAQQQGMYFGNAFFHQSPCEEGVRVGENELLAELISPSLFMREEIFKNANESDISAENSTRSCWIR